MKCQGMEHIASKWSPVQQKENISSIKPHSLMRGGLGERQQTKGRGMRKYYGILLTVLVI